MRSSHAVSPPMLVVLIQPFPTRLASARCRVLPQRKDSEGGWGYVGVGRFKRADDGALVVTTKGGGEDDSGAQATDPGTLRPYPVVQTSSLNKTQAKPSPHGSYTD